MKYEEYKLKNGAKLILVPSNETKAVSVMAIFGVGSRYESEKINGASHFIEHLMFKGTEKRPNTLAISKELDSVGAEFNAMTAKDWTAYYIKIDSEKIDLAVDVLSDMLLNSKFDENEINRERGVIVEEINMYEDNPLMYIEDLLEQCIFDGNPLGWQISGPREVIKTVSRQELLDYKNAFYQPNNLVIAVSGKFPDDIKEKIEKAFSFEATSQEPPEFSKFVFDQTEPKLMIKKQATEQVQLAFGFPGFPYGDDRVFALYLLAIILGGNMSSRLFINIRERKGLCYFIRSYINIYKDTGNLIVQAGLDKNRIKEAISLILDELKKIRDGRVTEDELKDAKQFLRGKVILHLEDSSEAAEWFAKQAALTGEILTPEQKFALFDKVTVEDVEKVAKEVLLKRFLNLALIGPFDEGGEDFKKLLEL
ncbi:MAG TPA: pitrilysin family protein [Candidatus Bipolaricaulota bacterium]|nr:pitrilysin family protein [Candidatus Bipolaricaulota bacterium]